MSLRFIDAGQVSALRSQTIYHGLGHARSEATPDTIVLARPAQPYVCIGFHQDLEHEVDLEYCRARELPVLRRETGGGAVYLDRNQLFVQWIMDPARLPARIEQRFELFSGALVATYRELGIDACPRGANEVHVDGRKIAGTGAARIGAAEVLVGNLIFDFDTDECARILRAPSPAFRDQVHKSLALYMTSMHRELGVVPDPARVAAVYRAQCQELLADELICGEWTPRELAAIEASDEKLASPDFLYSSGGLKRDGLKIHADVSVVESVRESAARMRNGRVEDISMAPSNPQP